MNFISLTRKFLIKHYLKFGAVLITSLFLSVLVTSGTGGFESISNVFSSFFRAPTSTTVSVADKVTFSDSVSVKVTRANGTVEFYSG